MKKTVLLSLLMAICLPVMAQDSEYAVTVPATNSTVILPPRKAQITADAGWVATNAVTQGQILFGVTANEYYMVLAAGTTGTNAPTGTAGQTEANGSATLIHCNRTDGREKALVTQAADAEVWYQTGTSADNTGGEYTFAKGQQYSTSEDGAVSVYSTEGVVLHIIDK